MNEIQTVFIGLMIIFIALASACMASGLYNFWREIFINRLPRLPSCKYESHDLQSYKTECGNDFFNSNDSQPVTDWATYCPYCSGKIKERNA